jgi:hypothetical protein
MSGRTIILILLLATALRVSLLAAAWDRPTHPFAPGAYDQAPEGVQTPDSVGYLYLADDVRHGFFGGREPEIFRTPGYPIFLMLGSVLGGPNHWWHVILIVQLVIDVLLVYLTYLLAWAVFDPRAAAWAAAFQATSAIAIASSMRLLSDGLFAMLLTLAVLLFVHYWKFSRRWSLLASAAVLAAGCYVRPTGLVFAAILATALLARAVGRGLTSRRGPISEAHIGIGLLSPRRAFLDLAMYAGIGILLLGPWVARNAVRADYRGFSSFASDSVYADAVPELLAHLQPEKRGQAPFSNNEKGASPLFSSPLFSDAEAGRQYMRDLDHADEIAHGPRTPGQAARFRQEYSARVIGEHPWLYARLHVKGVVGFFLPGATDVLEIAGLSHGQRGTSDVLRKQGPWAAAKYYFGDEGVPHRGAAMGLTAIITTITAVQYLGVILFLVRRKWRGNRGPGNRGLRPMSSAKSVSVPDFPRPISSESRKWGQAPISNGEIGASPHFQPSLSFLLLAMIVIASLLSGPYGFPRYQTMIVPLLSIFAAAGRPWSVRRRE